MREEDTSNISGGETDCCKSQATISPAATPRTDAERRGDNLELRVHQLMRESAALRTEVEELRGQLAALQLKFDVTDRSHRSIEEVLEDIPGCCVHGIPDVSVALKWVSDAKTAERQLAEAQNTLSATLFQLDEARKDAERYWPFVEMVAKDRLPPTMQDVADAMTMYGERRRRALKENGNG